MLSRLWSRAWSPAWRLLTIAVVLLLLHSLWGYVEARRLESASRAIAAVGLPSGGAQGDRLDDAARFYEAAWTLDPGLPVRGKDPDEQVQRPRDLELLRAMEASLEMLDRGSALPACRYVWKYDLPPLRSIRQVARAASIRTGERLRAADAGGALKSTISTLRHLRVFNPDAPLIGYFLRMVLVEMALDDTKRFLEHTPTGDDRARLQEAVAALILPNEIEAAFTAERAWLSHEIGRGLDDGFDLPYADNWIARPAVRHFAVAALDYTGRAIVNARAPWPERIRWIQAMPRPWGPAGLVEPSYRGAVNSMALSAALSHAMLDCLGVERYRHARGDLPEILDGAHVDPFTGQPLRYRREESGYVVYSVGEDGKDDGGSVEAAVGAPKGHAKDYGYRIRIDPQRSGAASRGHNPKPGGAISPAAG